VVLGRRAAIVVGLGAGIFSPLTRPVAGQPPARRAAVNPDSVRLIADLFFRAVADERWEGAAAFVDTTAVRRMVLERLRWRRSEPTRRQMTIEDFMRDDPQKPRVVAEYELKRWRDQMALTPSDGITYEFDGVKSVDELGTMSAREATARFIKAQDDRVRMRASLVRSGCGDSMMALPFTMRRILGVVLVGDTLAYVLHNDLPPEAGLMPGMEPMVMQLRLRSGSWRITPTHVLLRRAGSTVAVTRCDSTMRPRPPG
jgi:hypothetical protein